MAGTAWIISAWYGAPPQGNAGPNNTGFYDVTAYVAAQLAASNGAPVTITASNAAFGGDPNPGVVKSLTIVYAFAPGPPATAVGAPGVYPFGSFQAVPASCVENQSITLPPAWMRA